MRLLAATLKQSLESENAKHAEAARGAAEKRAVYEREVGKLKALIERVKAARMAPAAAVAATAAAAPLEMEMA